MQLKSPKLEPTLTIHLNTSIDFQPLDLTRTNSSDKSLNSQSPTSIAKSPRDSQAVTFESFSTLLEEGERNASAKRRAKALLPKMNLSIETHSDDEHPLPNIESPAIKSESSHVENNRNSESLSDRHNETQGLEQLVLKDPDLRKWHFIRRANNSEYEKAYMAARNANELDNFFARVYQID